MACLEPSVKVRLPVQLHLPTMYTPDKLMPRERIRTSVHLNRETTDLGQGFRSPGVQQHAGVLCKRHSNERCSDAKPHKLESTPAQTTRQTRQVTTPQKQGPAHQCVYSQVSE